LDNLFMKRFAFIALFCIGCNPPTAPTINVDIDNNQIVSLADGGVADGKINGGSCKDVDKVNISAFPDSLSVGESDRIDVTPKDEDNKPRDPDCDIASGVKWESTEEFCTIKDDEEFVTTVRGVKSGTCEIEACVEGKCDSESFEIS